jgi:hypothetical protein
VAGAVVELGELDDEPQAAASTAVTAIEAATAPRRTLERVLRWTVGRSARLRWWFITSAYRGGTRLVHQAACNDDVRGARSVRGHLLEGFVTGMLQLGRARADHAARVAALVTAPVLGSALSAGRLPQSASSSASKMGSSEKR